MEIESTLSENFSTSETLNNNPQAELQRVDTIQSVQELNDLAAQPTDKPVEQLSNHELKVQQEKILSNIEKEISEEVAKIESETERQILDIAGETYIKIVQEVGLSEAEAIEMIGEDKMTRILGEEKVKQIKDEFNQEVICETMRILEDAYKEVDITLNEGSADLLKKIVEDTTINYKK